MVEVEAGIAAAVIVSNPLAVAMDVRGFRMTFLVAKCGPLGGGWMCLAVRGRRPMPGNVPASYSVASSVIAVLSPYGQGKNEGNCEKLES
jgi:hypothetical protein